MHLISKLRNNRRWITLILIALALYVILPQLGDFRQSITILKHPQWWMLLGAVVLSGLTYAAAAGTYYFLSFKKIAYRRAVLVQLAAMFINRLLPAGIGALGTNYAFLRHSGHSKSQAVTVVTVNNGLGLVGHLSLTIIILGLFHQHLPALHLKIIGDELVWLRVAITAVIVAVALLVGGFRKRLLRTASGLRQQLSYYRHQPSRLVAGLLTSMTLTVVNISCLWLCLLALHGSLSFVAVLVVFTFGVSLGSATPTPGGLGGVEAALVAGFVAYHISSSKSLAAVLLFRVITYWLALAVGSVAFAVCQRQGYLVNSVDDTRP